MPPKKLLNVVLVAPLPPPIGGIASWTVNVTDYYKTLENKEIALTLCDSSSKHRRITSRSQFTRIYTGIINSFRIYKKVKNLIKNKPDIIHLVSSASYSLLKDLLIIRLAKQNNIPVIAHWRFGRIPQLAEQPNWEYKLISKVIKKSKYSIVLDLLSYNTLISKGFTNICQMPNPISIGVANQCITVNENYQKRPPGNILFVGHVVKQKGVFELVEACAVIEKVECLTLVGPYEEHTKVALMEIAKKRASGAWLIFEGALEKSKVLEKMRAHSMVALPSYTEGFPNVVLEGMAMGAAIIATNVGAIPQMLDIESKQKCGLCVKPKNTEELTKAIEYAVTSPNKLQEMGQNGIKKVLANYTMQKVFSDYQKLWRSNTTP